MSDATAWGILVVVWIALIALPYFYWALVTPDHPTIWKIMLTWIVGFVALLLVWNAGAPASTGNTWSAFYLIAVLAGWWWLRRRSRPPVERDQSKTGLIEMKTSRRVSLRVIFAGMAAFLICVFMGDEIGSYFADWATYSYPFNGGMVGVPEALGDLFYGNGAKLISALVTLFGGYLLANSREV